MSLQDPEILDVEKRWRMSKSGFNAWRRANDLPILLDVFKRTLPFFGEWQTQNQISDEDFLSADYPSGLFVGNITKHLVDYAQPDGQGEAADRVVSILFDSGWDLKAQSEHVYPGYSVQIHSSKPFCPFFAWLKKEKGTRFFRIWDNPR